MTTTSCECMTRNLGAFEHLIWLIDQWSPRHFLLAARIEGAPLSPDGLRGAFLPAQRRHPALRTSIQVDPGGVPHFEPWDAPVELLAAIMLEGPIDGCRAPVNVRHLCPPV